MSKLLDVNYRLVIAAVIGGVATSLSYLKVVYNGPNCGSLVALQPGIPYCSVWRGYPFWFQTSFYQTSWNILRLVGDIGLWTLLAYVLIYAANKYVLSRRA